MENKNLVMDYYQLTMAYSYFKQNKQNDIAYFDMFYRKILIMEDMLFQRD